MKKTKKAIALLMATTLCMGLSVPVFAEDADPTNEKVTTIPDTGAGHTHNVYAKIKDTTATVYSVNLTWSSMYFAWQGDKGTWDPENLVYTDGTKSGSWVAMKGSEDDAGEYTADDGYHSVNIENRSNAAVKAQVTASSEGSVENTPTTLSAILTAPNVESEKGVSVKGDQLGIQVKIGLNSADNKSITGDGINEAYSAKVKVGVSDPTDYTKIGESYVQIGKVYVKLEAWDGTSEL